MGSPVAVRSYRFVSLRSISKQTFGTSDQIETTTHGKHKTIDDLPGPSLATTVYWLFVKGYVDKSHAMQVNIVLRHLDFIAA